MKSRLITFTIIAITLIAATVTMATGTLITETILEDATDSSESLFCMEEDFEFDFNFEPIIPQEMMTEIHFELEQEVLEVFSIESVKNTFADVCTVIAENDIESTDGMKIKNDFIASALNYNMNPTELEYVKQLFTEGYDIQKVLEIYEFIRWTDCDLTAIADIYDAGIENSDKENWIYEAYDRFFDRTDDILSVEDIAYYVGRGITVEEIAGVYELSFAGAKTTKQMLSERLSGESWNTITASSLSKTPEVVIDAPEMTMDEIMWFRNISVRQRKDFADIAVVREERVELNEEARSAERTRILEKDRLMVEYEVTPVSDETKEERTVEYANDSPQEFSVEKVREEDLIPVEEPEVE